MKFLVINGVNLNLTGKREKGVYGSASLDEINETIAAHCAANGDSADFYQSTIEGELVNKLNDAFLFCSTQARSPITAMLCATRSRRSIFPLPRCTCLTCTRARSFATTAYCPRCARA